MSKKLGTALRQARQWKKLTQGDVAKHLGVSRAAVGQWEAGDNAPSTLNLLSLCELLEIEVGAAMEGVVQHDMFPGYRSDEGHQDKIARDAAVAKTTDQQNVNIYKSTAEGSADLRVYEQVVGSVARPAGLLRTFGAIALYAVGSTMAPRFNEGDLIFLSGSRTPSLNDFVLIRMFGGENEGWFDCYIRQLVQRSDRKITVRQLSPNKTLEINLSDVMAIDRIFPWNEIIGA